MFMYVLLMSAVLLLCVSTVSNPEADDKKVKKAQRLLDDMGPRHAALAGLSADFGCEAARLLRLFDTSFLPLKSILG